MDRRTRLWSAGILACALALPAVRPQAVPADERAADWHVSADNDYFNFWDAPRKRPDVGYTHGLDAVVHGNQVPRWVKALAPRALEREDARFGAPRSVFSVRQAIYVPWKLPPDRPFAGWLEAGFGIRKESALGYREGRLRIGVTGPPSLAERTQALIHRGFGFGRGRAWSEQLPFEPGIAIEYGGAQRLFAKGPEQRPAARTAVHWRGRLGTFATDARLGVETTLGFDPPAPWREARHGVRGDALYLIGGGRVDLVVRDEFLDGTLFRASRYTGKHSVVPQLEYGIGTRFGGARIEWRVTRRGREYARQPDLHTYSTIAFSWSPGP